MRLFLHHETTRTWRGWEVRPYVCGGSEAPLQVGRSKVFGSHISASRYVRAEDAAHEDRLKTPNRLDANNQQENEGTV